MSNQEESQVKAQAFVNRILEDAAFREQAAANPDAALAAAGLTPAAMGDFIKQGNVGAEVSGYLESEGCDLFSCWVSLHPGLFCGTTH
ncbi:MAG TPA: hypothetical protein VN837_16330 [Chloroflexota bacterium]|nr:hypothetical protein [Chloroflexota bacterium]